MKIGRIGAALVILVSIGLVDRAIACLAAPEEHFLDPTEQEQDVEAPGTPVISGVSVKRGVGPQSRGCGGEESASSLDDLGIVSISIGETLDDRTPPESMGYDLSLASGVLPEGMTLSPFAIRTMDGVLQLSWIDGAEDDQEPISFELYIVAIDLGGNQGPATTVTVQEEGSE